jgi:YfiH family protein
VQALCTTRAGGMSTGAYASMNLGDHVGDAPQAVAANRARLAAALRGPGGAVRPVFLDQVHGAAVVRLDPGTPDRTAADGAWTAERGVACTVLVADCLPVLFTDRAGRRVAAAHAGWRGLAGGVLEAVFQCFRAPALTPYGFDAPNSEAIEARDMLAWLGPCIGPQAFEVGPEVRAAFCAADADAGRHFAAQPGGKFLAHLPALARQRLAALGVAQVYGNDGSAAWCTVAQPSRFFSHRRDGGASGTGRMAACIWLG